jgi:hypothetical protein
MKKLWLMAFLGAGCGVNVQPVDDFIGQMAAEQCAWQFRCCNGAEIEKLDGRKFEDQAGCVPYRALALEAELFLHRLAAREGRLKVDDRRARACIAQLQAKECNPKPGVPATPMDPMAIDACLEVFEGTTPIGQACVYANECVRGARCVSDKAAVGRGVCVPFQQSSQICNVDTDCDPKVPNLYCAKSDFSCHLRGAQGEKCEYTTDSAGHNPTLPMLLECQTGLFCDPISSTCRRFPGDGEACLSPPPPGVASSCNPDPTLGLVCDTTSITNKVCRAPGKLNESCLTIACEKDLYCDTTTDTCKALPALDQSCETSGFRCKTPFFCNTAKVPRVCDEPASVGQDCAQTPCYPDGYCDTVTRRCKPRLPDGTACTVSTDCLSNDCRVSVGGTMTTCQPRAIVVQCIGANEKRSL